MWIFAVAKLSVRLRSDGIKVEQRLKWLELKNKKRYLVSFEFSPFYRSSSSSSESTGASLWCLFLFLTTTSSPTAIFICCGCWNIFWKHCHFVEKCNKKQLGPLSHIGSLLDFVVATISHRSNTKGDKDNTNLRLPKVRVHSEPLNQVWSRAGRP